jgi:hypothetical protein
MHLGAFLKYKLASLRGILESDAKIYVYNYDATLITRSYKSRSTSGIQRCHFSLLSRRVLSNTCPQVERYSTHAVYTE